MLLLFWIGCSNPLEECREICSLPEKCKEGFRKEAVKNPEALQDLGVEFEKAITIACEKRARNKKRCLEDCNLQHSQ